MAGPRGRAVRAPGPGPQRVGEGRVTGAGDIYDLSGKRVLVLGHRGLAGSALSRRLRAEPCVLLAAGRQEADLRRQTAAEQLLACLQPNVVILAAATVGGIQANMDRPADFIMDNLMIQTNVLEAARRAGVEKLLLLGSSCIYPANAPQPLSEKSLGTGPLEPTNAPYAMAKLAAIAAAQALRRQHGFDAITAMPCNLYGPGDTFAPETSHVPAALLRRFHEARVAGAAEAVVWGSGRPRREFLFVDDFADACVLLLKRYSGATPVNVGTGVDLSIAEFATLVAGVTGFRGRLVFDPARPDGIARKVLDVRRITALGWRPKTPLEEGLRQTYGWYRDALDGA